MVSDDLDIPGRPRPIPLHGRRRLRSRQGSDAQLRARSTLCDHDVWSGVTVVETPAGME